MRNIFQHKYIVNLLTFIALALALICFSLPKIESYNSAVEDKQIDLTIQANGVSDRISFSKGYSDELHPLFYAEIVLFLILFSSLLLTKRILFSFLFVFLFYSQFIILFYFFCSAVKFPMSYFYNYQSFSLIFIASVLALSYWQTSLFCRPFYQKFQAENNLK